VAEWAKTAGVGIAVAALTAGFMFFGMKTGISPFPEPVGLAFAETAFGTTLPLPIGLLFHLAWVMLFTVVYVVLFRDALTFTRAFWLAFALWVLALVFFFPIVGWGFLGLAISPKLIVAAAVPHLLFAIFLWGLSSISFRPEHKAGARRPSHGRPSA
jgi:hypothetical protein